MTDETRAGSARERQVESRRRALPFAVALGHRLRQVREQQRMTAAEVAAHSQFVGLRWDRSTVARVELGQRQVSAAELMLLPLLYNRPVTDLLPTERCLLGHGATASPAGMRAALTRAPHVGDYELPDLDAALGTGFDQMREVAKRVSDRFPGVPGMTLLAASRHGQEETTAKAARRLGVDAFDVAVAAEQLWERGLAAERDARLGDTKGLPRRALQARRGHITRALLDELAPVVEEIVGARQRKDFS